VPYDMPSPAAEEAYGGDYDDEYSKREAKPAAPSRSRAVGAGGGGGAGAGTGYRGVTGEDLERNYRTLVAGQGVGSLFRYDLDEPITVRDRESALVSIVSKKVPGDDVLLYRAGLDGQNPYRTVRLTNDTGFVLERGPVAIYRDGTFLGEALTARMEKGATTFVPYALDSRIDVFLSQEYREEGMRLVSIVNGRLIAESKQVTKFRYEIDNRSNEAATMYVQRARRTGWTITRVGLEGDGAGPPQPGKAGVIEEDLVTYVPIALPASGKITIAVEEETPGRGDMEILADQGREIIRAYILNPDADPKVSEQLKAAVELSDKLASIDRRIVELEKQRRVVGERETQVRDNLNLLRKQSKANEQLRKQLEETLAGLEKTLDDLTREFVQLGEERYKLSERLAQTLKNVTLKK